MYNCRNVRSASEGIYEKEISLQLWIIATSKLKLSLYCHIYANDF